MSSLEEQLQAVEQEFEEAMRARGFDPSQADNVALTSTLAKLYEQRETLRLKVADSITDSEDEKE